jgi:hypothetical protein
LVSEQPCSTVIDSAGYFPAVADGITLEIHGIEGLAGKAIQLTNGRQLNRRSGCVSLDLEGKRFLMRQSAQLRYLQIALTLTGAFCVVGVYPLTVLWPSGWAWHVQGPSLYLQMIIGIYATLGVFLVLASKNPLDHLSLIWFSVWSSIIHGGIMAVQATMYPEHHGHLYGDVPVLFVAAAVLAWLTPKKSEMTGAET